MKALRASIIVAIAGLALACGGPVANDDGEDIASDEEALATYAVFSPPGYPDRPVYLHWPAGLAFRAPAPLLLVFHGGGHDAEKMVKITCPGGRTTSTGCLHRVAERAGFVTAFLSGTQGGAGRTVRTWNAGGGRNGFSCISNYACDTNVDDLDYVDAVLDAIESTLNVDRDRFYATGVSNGGALAHRLACQMSDRIAAIAAVAAGNQFSTTARCSPRNVISILDVHGTGDELWPFDGGTMPMNPGNGIGMYESSEDWARRNGCASTRSITELPDRDARDGTVAYRERWDRCRDGDVELVVIEGGGHTWPSGWQYAPIGDVGRTSRDVNANELIVDFFRTH